MALFKSFHIVTLIFFGVGPTLPQQSEDSIVSPTCLSCLCEATSSCNLQFTCAGPACGPLHITQPSWVDSGKPTVYNLDPNGPNAFNRCSRNLNCSRKVVEEYSKKFKRDCNGDGKINCDDFVAIHKYGPTGCIGSKLPKKFGERYYKCKNEHLHDIDKEEETVIIPNEDESTDTIVIPVEDILNTEEEDIEIELLHLTNLDDVCLRCLCMAATNCNLTYGCHKDQCGPYKISLKYWENAGKPTLEIGRYSNESDATRYENCAQSLKCSEQVVEGYMNIWARDYNGDGKTDCEDFLLIHMSDGIMYNNNKFEQNESTLSALKMGRGKCSFHEVVFSKEEKKMLFLVNKAKCTTTLYYYYYYITTLVMYYFCN